MKCQVSQGELKSALATATRAVASKAPLDLPSLLHLLLQVTDEGKLSITGSDLSLTITTTIEANVSRPGKIGVPARLFADYIASLGDDECTLEVKPGTQALVVTAGRHRANFHGLEAADFAPRPEIDKQMEITLDVESLREGVAQTAMSASNDDTELALSGVLFHFGVDDGLTLVATDRHRLSMRRFTVDGVQEEKKALIPAKHLLATAQSLRESEKEVTVTLSTPGHHLFFIQPGLEISSRLLAGEYPNYGRLISSLQFLTTVRMPAADIAQAVKTASVLARDKARQLEFVVGPDSLVVKSGGDDFGSEEAALDANVEGEELTVAFNSRYIADALAQISESDVELQFGPPLKPVTLRGSGRADQLMLVVPLKTSN